MTSKEDKWFAKAYKRGFKLQQNKKKMRQNL